MRLAGFTSRWIIPLVWAASNASATCLPISIRFAGSSGPLRIFSASVSPSTYSIAIKRTPSLSPSELGAQKGVVSLAGRVQPGVDGDEYGKGLRFRLRDIKGGSTKTVTVLYTGSVSDQFRPGREVSVKGELRNGVFVAVKDSLVTKCPSKYTAKKST